MKKILFPALCSIFLLNCNQDLPTKADSKGQEAGAFDIGPAGSIDISGSDLAILKKSYALAKASGLRIKDAEAQEVLAKYLAMALANALSESQVREALKGEIAKKFDGDFNVLWSKLKGVDLENVTFAGRIRREFSADAQANGIMEMFDALRRLQVAIPENFEKWDGRTPLLVAWVPFTKDDLNTDFLLAYDREQREYRIDGKKAPENPVVVISKNERTNNNEELLSGIFIENGNGNLVPSRGMLVPSSSGTDLNSGGEVKTGYPLDKPVEKPAPLMKTAAFAQTPRVPLYWERIKVTEDLEGWFMGGMEIRMHFLSDKEVGLTADKTGIYEDNNYHANIFLRNINEDIVRYIGTKFTEIDDNDWDKNFTFKLSADIAKKILGETTSGGAAGEIKYDFGADTDDDYCGENNKIELGSQDVGTYWTAGYARVKFNYDPGIVEYDVTAMPYVSATSTEGRGNGWDLTDQYGNNVSDGEDVTYRLIVPLNETNTYRISTCDAMTNYDTRIQIFDKDYGMPYSNDDDYSCPSSYYHSTITAQLSGGTYYIVVDGWNGYVGTFKLSVQKV